MLLCSSMNHNHIFVPVDHSPVFRVVSLLLFALLCLCSLTETLKRFAVILRRIEITHPFVHNGDHIVTGPSEMNPLEMSENENEPQTVLISNP